VEWEEPLLARRSSVAQDLLPRLRAALLATSRRHAPRRAHSLPATAARWVADGGVAGEGLLLSSSAPTVATKSGRWQRGQQPPQQEGAIWSRAAVHMPAGTQMRRDVHYVEFLAEPAPVDPSVPPPLIILITCAPAQDPDMTEIGCCLVTCCASHG
jgi:hypothetical protein